MTRIPLSFPAIDAGAGGLAFSWWEEINESARWQDGIFFSLCAAYGAVSAIAFIQLIRIELRAHENGWTTQKVFHLMNFIVNGVRAVVFGFHKHVYLLHPKALTLMLLEFPGLLFFSTYTLLVLFWAEIYHQARSLPSDKLRIVYISINSVIYIIQGCIWVYLWINDSSIVEFIGKIFIAVVSCAAALGFLLYGGRLFLMLNQFPIESKGRRKKLHEEKKMKKAGGVAAAPTRRARRGEGDVKYLITAAKSQFLWWMRRARAVFLNQAPHLPSPRLSLHAGRLIDASGTPYTLRRTLYANRLLGFCLEGREKLLVYEFVQNASLDHFLFDPIKRSHLDWEKRYKIIGGIARGILCLHEDSQLRIIHRDLKPNNVLLDALMSPKIADSGMARLFEQDETQGNTSRIAGTFGYMAPEYAMHGQFSVKSDVFSFGVLLLEIISGEKNNCVRRGESLEDLLSFAWKNWKASTATNFIDPCLRSGSGTIREMVRCIHIGLLCVQEDPTERPTMASVILMLNSFSLTLAAPSEPAFYMNSQSGFESSSKGSLPMQHDDSSHNDASVTALYPR